MFYYEVCLKLIDRQLQNSKVSGFAMDFMKQLVENGQGFELSHLIEIVNALRSNEQLESEEGFT